MNKRQIVLTALLSSLFTLAIIIGSISSFSRAVAAPAKQVDPPNDLDTATYISVSSLVFEPLDRNTRYIKNTARQLLILNSQTRNYNVFAALLTLPDQSILTGLTVFGEDFDNQGAVTVRLKRCDHGQARCLSLAQPTSTDAFALGQFETVKLTNLYEVVDNSLFSYYLELDLTALANSGLRSVRVKVLDRGVSSAPVGSVETWSLNGNLTSFVIPNSGVTEVRVCTNDLSALPNSTHYPTLVVDGRSIRLSSNDCRTVVGLVMEVRRPLNTGPSSGTYQFLR